MLLFLLGIVLLTALCVLFVWLGGVKFDSEGLVGIGVCGLVVSFGLLLVWASNVWDYVAAGYKVDIINREFNTNYTQAEVFYASDVIDTIRELKRTRVELNGDLMLGKTE